LAKEYVVDEINGPYHTIQEAINAATTHGGKSRILCERGYYSECITIPKGAEDNLKFVARSDGPKVRATPLWR